MTDDKPLSFVNKTVILLSKPMGGIMSDPVKKNSRSCKLMSEPSSVYQFKDIIYTVCSVPRPLRNNFIQATALSHYSTHSTPKQYSELRVYVPALDRRARTKTRPAGQGPIAVSNQHIVNTYIYNAKVTHIDTYRAIGLHGVTQSSTSPSLSIRTPLSCMRVLVGGDQFILSVEPCPLLCLWSPC